MLLGSAQCDAIAEAVSCNMDPCCSTMKAGSKQTPSEGEGVRGLVGCVLRGVHAKGLLGPRLVALSVKCEDESWHTLFFDV